jgi:hypothetical protein
VTVAATVVTNTPQSFPNHTHFSDYGVEVPGVKAGDAWAGQHVGIRFLSTVTTDLQGGYWDLDHVRLTSALVPVLSEPTHAHGQVQFTLISEPGHIFEVLASPSIATPLAEWSRVTTLTNTTGTVVFTEAATNGPGRFYRTRQLP